MPDTAATAGGYVAIYRRLREHEIYLRKPLEWRAIWLHLLLSVNYADDTPARGLKRGEGVFVWACTKQYLRNCSYETWRRCLTYLISAQMITHAGHKITILQYGDYQPSTVMPPVPQKEALPQPVGTTVPVTTKRVNRRRTTPTHETWLTPFATLWQTKLGGTFNFGAAGKSLSALKKLGYSEIQIRTALENYLAATNAQYCSISHFAGRIRTYLSAPAPNKTVYDPTDMFVNKEGLKP